MIRFGLRGARFLATSRLGGPRAERALYTVTRNGFRTFAAAQRLGRPARLRTARGDLFDLTPTEEQQMLQEALREFAVQRLRPAALDADAACGAPAALLAEAGELGLGMLGVAEELGGAVAERSSVTAVLAAEALAYGDMGLAVAALAPGAVCSALTLWGDADQQAAYVRDDGVAALAILEPEPLFDPFALKTTARRSGADYVLSGVKALVPRAAEADLLLVAAQAETGPALFVVEAAGVVETRPAPALGLRAAATCDVRLNDVRVPAAALIPDGYAECVRRSRLAWAALSMGCGRAVLDYVIPAVNERVAFGEPVSHRQAVAFAVADVAVELEGLRLAALRAAARADAGDEFAREAAIARRLAAEYGRRIGSDGVQLLGGHGYVKEHPVERWYRDLRAAGVMEGALLV